MYGARFAIYTEDPGMIPGIMEALGGSLERAGCGSVSSHSWIIASCGSVLVKVRVELGMGAPMEPVRAPAVKVEALSSEPEGVRWVGELLGGALKGVNAALVLEG
ncbi:MAG: hypothetical protein GSR86_03575 [Desulfurococcales archaeon]|nr:hypothetical protein [Desulfurococcales archaeon]